MTHQSPQRLTTNASLCLAGALLASAPAAGGPYSPGLGGAAESGIIDAGVPGFVGPDGDGLVTANNAVNPAFVAWATQVVDYSPTPGVSSSWLNANNVLGPVTGNNFDIASLGDLYDPASPPTIGSTPPFSDDGEPYAGDPADPADGFGFLGFDAPGSITLAFDTPITNGPGADFAAFENGFVSLVTTPDGSVAGNMFAELGYVEVSSNGTDFARLPSEYLNFPNGSGLPANTAFLTQDVTNVYNLVGKHANSGGQSWGTPFDLDDLATDPLVLDGTVTLARVTHVRIVDIVGNGSSTDASGHAIYDSWVTVGSGGLDLEAVGVLNAFVPAAGDFDADGDIDADDIDLLFAAIGGGDLAFDLTTDATIDSADVDELVLSILGTARGDANLDGEVSTPDLAILASGFGQPSSGWAGADFNGDGQVDTADLAILAASFGFGVSPVSSGDVAAVPEPSTALACVLLGGAGLTIRRRRID
ncbi:MAG: dockerin type I domain-containing protein [Planctomycetota bacterium]